MTPVTSQDQLEGQSCALVNLPKTFCGPDGQPFATLEENQWESEFFGRPIGRINVLHPGGGPHGDAEVGRGVRSIAAEADRAGFEFVQCHVDVRDLRMVRALEDVGFRLVDTRISFVTKMHRREFESYSIPFGTVEFARQEDLGPLLRLTHEAFVENPGFFSRYKDRTWFTQKESRRWFSAWIENHVTHPKGMFAVWRVKGDLVGYFIYAHGGVQEDGAPLLKGILAAVETPFKQHRAHLFMQRWIFDQLSEDVFWIDNTTQLTNFSTLRNHMRSQKNLECIYLTFFRGLGAS